MRVISFVSQKGGSGKTTLCFSIGVAAYEAGRKVLMLDLDRQASLRDWYADREAEEPEVDTVELPKLEEALGGLEKLGFDYVFIDTPGKDDPANSKAITLSDFCIIPCRPTPGDMKAIRPTIANVDRVGKPTAFVLTQTPPKSFRVTEAKTARSSTRPRCLSLHPREGLRLRPLLRSIKSAQSTYSGLPLVSEHSSPRPWSASTER
jgi:chromosome partitioning protein